MFPRLLVLACAAGECYLGKVTVRGMDVYICVCSVLMYVLVRSRKSQERQEDEM